jgi:DNA-binding SARP family transcriptional activator
VIQQATMPFPGQPPATATRFVLLGRIEAHHRDGRLTLGRRRERCLLAVLLLDANRVVSASRLEDLLWNGHPPVSARANLHTHVSRLRAQLDLDGSGRHGVRLNARDGGYVIEVERNAIDAHLFTAMVERVRADADPVRRAAMLRSGLALWQGPVLADAGSVLLRRRVAAGMDELRLTANEPALDAELECGRHDEVVGEIKRLASEHLLREGLWTRLALALYRVGRQAETLEAIAWARERLAMELGIDPGPGLRRLQNDILTASPALEAGLPGPTNDIGLRMLPMDLPEFTGRQSEWAQVQALAEEAIDCPAAPVLCAIEGMAGVGKTRFAVHAGHRLTYRYNDDVQLWADLHGFDPHQRPSDPAAVLGALVRLLGVPASQVPDGLEARAALYRSRLVGRRTLILLDNVAEAEQVRPLLPGGGPCLVLLTHRAAFPAWMAYARCGWMCSRPPKPPRCSRASPAASESTVSERKWPTSLVCAVTYRSRSRSPAGSCEPNRAGPCTTWSPARRWANDG